MSKSAKVVIVMGSRSDLPIMKDAQDVLNELGVKTSIQILSAHRTPELLQTEMQKFEKSGVQVVIAGAGGAAHLPGMLASFGVLPVIGVPVGNSKLRGLDSLLSIVQMPKGIPVATVAIDNSYNAGLLAARILALSDKGLSQKVSRYKSNLKSKVLKDRRKLSTQGVKAFLK